jgi:hypothetical protein
MTEEGRNISGSARIPVKEMAMGMLDKMFPHLTEAQLHSLRTGEPMPPSPGMLQLADNKLTPAEEIAAYRQCYDGLLYRQVVARMQDAPLVTCILPYGRESPHFVHMARKAVNQFVNQSYPNKQLIVVNSTANNIVTQSHPWVKEVRVEGPSCIADLVNVGLRLAEGDWVKPCWDDDDYYDPELLTFMMMHRQGGRAIMLSKQFRMRVHKVSEETWEPTVCAVEDKAGIPNTMIFPHNTLGDYPKFRDVEHEDVAYVNENYGLRRVVIDNSEFPASTLSVAIHHGRNRTSLQEFMGEFSAPERQGQWAVSPEESRHIRMVLALFGLHATTKPIAKGEPVSTS